MRNLTTIFNRYIRIIFVKFTISLHVVCIKVIKSTSVLQYVKSAWFLSTDISLELPSPTPRWSIGLKTGLRQLLQDLDVCSIKTQETVLSTLARCVCLSLYRIWRSGDILWQINAEDQLIERESHSCSCHYNLIITGMNWTVFKWIDWTCSLTIPYDNFCCELVRYKLLNLIHGPIHLGQSLWATLPTT